ncbi:MAG: hypothetical protein F6K41_10945 [Symploca sp. SIO3E6]|nr:hypothetical protein [Caldora sp. SIO3E6]
MTNNIKWIGKIVATAMLFLAIAPQHQQIAQEEEEIPRVFLMDHTCVDTGTGNWKQETEDVSVGRAVYTSKLYMGAGNSFASMTCRIKPDHPEINYQALHLAFGMRDNDQDSPGVKVNLYLDGQKVGDHSWIVSPGRGVSTIIPLFNVENISLETICQNPSRRYCDRVYFWETSLEITVPIVIEEN